MRDRAARVAWARGRRCRVAGTESPRRRAAGSRRSKPKSVVRGSNRSEFGSGVIYATWVIHWRQQLGTTGLEGTKAAAAAALGVGARRRAVYRRLGQALAYGNMHKITGRSGNGLPRLELELRCRAGVLASKSSGESQAALGEEAIAGRLRAPGLHRSTRGVPAREPRRSGRLRVAGVEESGGGPNSHTAALDEIPARVWTKVGAAHSGKVLGTRRSCCAALGWLWRGGAARPRRRKGLGTTEQSGRGGSQAGGGCGMAR